MLEDRANLERAFEVLSGRERVILYLRFYESVSQTEIAKRLNVSQMHVSRLQQKALEKLKNRPPGILASLPRGGCHPVAWEARFP